ncbi:conserved hypothetical protein [Enterobacterales bacterium 8AC]|nr:conserved hypothetical protein [Enterobacterales bacterium 8AC]
MQQLNYTEQKLALQVLVARGAHELHRVRLFSPAICHVRQGRKTLQWGELVEVAAVDSLILFPAGVEIHIANTPSRGEYISDIVYIPQGLLSTFKTRNPDARSAGQAKLCVPFDEHTKRMWGGLLGSIKDRAPVQLQEHQLNGVLLALQLAGYAETLLGDRQDPLVARIQQLILLEPSHHWQVDEVASRLHMGSSTLRRHLAAEGQHFRTILEDVRMNKALYELQSSKRSVGEIAYRSGYACASRFAARFTQHFGLSPRALRSVMRNGDR